MRSKDAVEGGALTWVFGTAVLGIVKSLRTKCTASDAVVEKPRRFAHESLHCWIAATEDPVEIFEYFAALAGEHAR